MTQNTFGENLAALRKERGMSQEDLAALLDVSRQSVSKWESGKGYPSMERMLFLSDYYGVSLDELTRKAVSDHTERKYEEGSFSAQIDSFLTNLSPARKTVLYIVVLIILFLALEMIVFGAGHLAGTAAWHLTH